jgi:hypothetical protein
VEAAYRLFGLLPDTVDLGQLLLALYTEQVAGYYDPDSSALFAVGAEDRSQLRLVMAHELIHALQHQYLPLDSLLGQQGNGDALAAAQAVLEGQATLASIRVLTPGRDVTAQPGFWETYRGQVAEQQRRMPVFANAPLVLREGLLFPYVAGAALMRWWSDTRSTPLPAVAELPRSTEQVLHPERLALGDAPVTVRFTDSAPGLLYEDTLGELEAHILLAVLRGADQVAYDLALGWGGDRYRAVTTAAGPALVWVTVWDDGRYANRIAAELEARFTGVVRPGYRAAVDRMEADGRPVVRLVHAPAGWNGWEALPGFRLDANVPPR